MMFSKRILRQIFGHKKEKAKQEKTTGQYILFWTYFYYGDKIQGIEKSENVVGVGKLKNAHETDWKIS
jgi:hypothetical protein